MSLASGATSPQTWRPTSEAPLTDTFRISTRVTRNEDGDVLDFKVLCNPFSEEEQHVLETQVGSLKGFVHYCGMMPGAESFDVYDERSGHCLEALGIMRKRRAMIKRQLPRIDIDFIEQVILIEKAWVAPTHRGEGLALRLMREAQHVFARPQAFAILKAHPDGEQVSDADCLKLADYYSSDQRLGFKPVSKKALPGWLVANWNAPRRGPNDYMFWSASSAETAEEGDKTSKKPGDGMNHGRALR
jgi:ribosomal protein S18 acetylase RimI-like enzyme